MKTISFFENNYKQFLKQLQTIFMAYLSVHTIVFFLLIFLAFYLLNVYTLYFNA